MRAVARPDEANPKPRGTASIGDVARVAEVSIATVSRVVNNPALVAPATRARVLDAVRELGYQPNPIARALMTNKSRIIGVALPDIAGEFYSEILRGAEDEARAVGQRLLIASGSRGAADTDVHTALPYSLIDGLAVMITEPNDSLWKEAIGSGVPVCVLDAHIESDHVDNIVIDNQSAATDATRHLLRRSSPEQCCFVGGAEANFDSKERAAGFAAALTEAGAPARSDQIVFGSYTSDWGRQWATSMLDGVGLRGRAVLAGNDDIALGILFAARDAGLLPPDDFTVVGFDNTRLCTIVRPHLSSVRAPLREMGAAAIRMLLARAEDPARPSQRLELQAELVVRETS